MVLLDKKTIKFSFSNIEDLKGIVPKGVWLTMFDGNKGEFYLEKQEDFVLPKKVYGETERLAKRYLKTFNEEDKNLGVALTGLKGTGKSLLAKQICVNSGLAVIIVTVPYAGSGFSAFLSSIKQECIVFIDEFEKVYNERNVQENFLSVLDGVFTAKKLFLFTSNETSNYSNYLINRPGRIHYMQTFERISDEMLDQIVKENLNNQDHAKEFDEVISSIDEANVDMVFALIKECNRYEESPKVAVKYLNIAAMGNTDKSNYDVEVIDLKTKKTYLTKIRGSLLTPGCWLSADEEGAEEKPYDPAGSDDCDLELEIIVKDYVVTRNKRNITLTNDKYIIKSSPSEIYKFSF